jgi:hypothetical protein
MEHVNMVYFDDKLLQPNIVPPEFLRVVFDLPPEPEEHSAMDFCFHCNKKKEGHKSMMVSGIASMHNTARKIARGHTGRFTRGHVVIKRKRRML